MVKVFWLFAARDGSGTDGDPYRPHLPPGVGGRWTCPGDVRRLTGPTAAPHVHLLAGGIALPDDNLAGQTGEGHHHYLVEGVLVTVNGPEHSHDIDAAPAFYLLHWGGADSDAVAIAQDGQCYPVVENDVTVDDSGTHVGALKDGWATGDAEIWASRMLNMLGVSMPVEVDSGRRLVKLFLGALLSRVTSDVQVYGLR